MATRCGPRRSRRPTPRGTICGVTILPARYPHIQRGPEECLEWDLLASDWVLQSILCAHTW